MYICVVWYGNETELGGCGMVTSYLQWVWLCCDSKIVSVSPLHLVSLATAITETDIYTWHSHKGM